MDGHIPDLELSRFAHDPDSVEPARAAEIERHTAGCADCGARLDFYTVAEEDLHDPAVWKPMAGMAAALPMSVCTLLRGRRCGSGRAAEAVL